MKKLNIISAVLAAAASAAGIFLPLYTDAPWAVAQMKGQDTVTIIAAVILIVMTLKKETKPMMVTAGINAYLIYTYFFYALEVKLNPLFHVYLAVVLLSTISLIKTISSLRLRQKVEAAPGAVRFSIVYLCGIATILCILWNADIISTLTGKPMLETASDEPLTIVYVFDLTFVIPAIVYAVFLLIKRKPFGIPLCGIMLTKCVTMGAALLGMTIGAWAGGFELDTFLAVFWFILASGGTAAIALFMKGSVLNE